MRSGGCSSTPELEMDLGVGHVEYRVEQHAAKLGPRHRSSVVELSIRNRAVVGSNPTGGSCSLPARLTPRLRRGPWPSNRCARATPGVPGGASTKIELVRDDHGTR